MKKLRLKDLFSIKKGTKVEQVEVPSADCVRYIQIDDLRDNSNPKFCKPKENYVYANKNHIIIAWDGANAGTVSYGLEGAIGSTLAILETTEQDVYIPYVGRFLQYKNQYLRDTCTGATIPHISRKALENLVIPLPTKEEQRNISKLLDKTQELIDKRKAQIEALDQLSQSVFLEMFGSIEGEKVPLSDLCEINPSKTEVANLKEDMMVSFIPMANVSETGEVDLSEIRNLGEVYNGFTYFKENDVLFAKITPCMENGKGAIAKNLINGIGFGSTEFHVLRPIEGITSEWLYFLTTLPNFRQQAEKNMTGSAGQKRVPKQFFEKYKVIKPSIEMQEKFKEIVLKIDRQKEKLRNSLSIMEQNFQSIMQRTFKGELFTEEKISSLL